MHIPFRDGPSPLVVPEVAIFFSLGVGARLEVIALHILHAAGHSDLTHPNTEAQYIAVQDQDSVLANTW